TSCRCCPRRVRASCCGGAFRQWSKVAIRAISRRSRTLWRSSRSAWQSLLRSSRTKEKARVIPRFFSRSWCGLLLARVLRGVDVLDRVADRPLTHLLNDHVSLGPGEVRHIRL